MAYRVRAYVWFDWVPDGTGFTQLGQQQSDNPGTGSAQAASTVGAAQTLSLYQAETVPGGDSPTQANFNTALTNLASDIETQMGTGGAAYGNPATPLSLIQAFSTGGQ